LCNSGATLWLGGTTQLVDFYHLLCQVWAFLGQCKCQDVFNVFSDFGKLLYEFYVFTEDSKILSVGDVPCRVYLWF